MAALSNMSRHVIVGLLTLRARCCQSLLLAPPVVTMHALTRCRTARLTLTVPRSHPPCFMQRFFPLHCCFNSCMQEAYGKLQEWTVSSEAAAHKLAARAFALQKAMQVRPPTACTPQLPSGILSEKC